MPTPVIKVKLLPPTIDRQLITKDKYSTLPQIVQMLCSKYPHVWKVTISPRKTPDSGHCRILIIAAANMRSGPLLLENGGRVPVTAPPTDQDDLRPIVHYYMGTGTQTFKVVLTSNTNNYLQDTLKFD